MGVIHIRESNPFADFIRGLSPAVQAWGDRRQERGKANFANEVEAYKNAKAQLLTPQDIAGPSYRSATPEMYADDGFEDWTQGNFAGNMPLDEMVNSGYNSGLGQKLSDLLKIDQTNAQIQSNFDTQREAERARIQKEGADYYGADGIKAMLNQADQERRVEGLRFGLKDSYQDMMRATRDVALQNGDLATAAKITEALSPDLRYQYINMGDKMYQMGHDTKGNAPDTMQSFDIGITPGQQLNYQQTREGREFDWMKHKDNQAFQKEERALDRESRTNGAQYVNAKTSAAKQIVAAHQNWVKNNFGEEEINSPYYDQARQAMDYLYDVSVGSGNGDGGGQPTPQPRTPTPPGNYSVQELPTDQYRKAMDAIRQDAKAQGRNLTDNEIMMILEDQFSIKWKSSAR